MNTKTDKKIKIRKDNPDKKIDFGMASSEPLVLFDVNYDLDFEYDKKSMKKLSIFKKNLLNDIFRYHVD